MLVICRCKHDVAIDFFFPEIRRVIEKYAVATLPPVPANNEKAGYGYVQLEETSNLFDIIGIQDNSNVVESADPIPMESVGQVNHDFSIVTIIYILSVFLKLVGVISI